MSNTVETHPNVVSATAVIGDSVVNLAGENLGKIEELMLDPEKGRVTYAVLSFDGAMGTGEKLFFFPFEALKLDASREHFTLDVDQDKLKNAPGFDKNHPPKAADRTPGTEAYKLYGYKPGRELSGWIREGVRAMYAESWIKKGFPSLYPEGLYAESNKDLCRRFIQKILNEGELSSIWDFMSPDVVNHELADSIGDGKPPEGRGIEWMADFVNIYRRAFPDLHIEIQDQIAEGDRVVTCLRMRGTQKNPLMTIAASGRKMDVAGIRVDRLIGGKIVESWAHVDVLGMLRQLDAMPALDRRPQKVTPVSGETVTGSNLPVAGRNPAPVLPLPPLVS